MLVVAQLLRALLLRTLLRESPQEGRLQQAVGDERSVPVSHRDSLRARLFAVVETAALPVRLLLHRTPRRKLPREGRLRQDHSCNRLQPSVKAGVVHS